MDEIPEERARRLAGTGVTLALSPFCVWATCLTGVVDYEHSSVPGYAWIATCVLSLVGMGFGIASLSARRSPLGWTATVLGLLSPALTAALGLAMIDFTRGRALRRRGMPQLPGEQTSPHWCAPTECIEVSADDAARLAIGWRRNAATETASVAAFASLANQLLALGAPSRLVELAHADAISEIRHARLCYGLASAFDGRELGPGPFPAATLAPDRPTTAVGLAAECLRESCVLEAASANVARELASRRDLHPCVRPVVEQIAHDEREHAEHGFETLAWLAADLGERERDHLARSLVAMRSERVRAVSDDDRDERWGLAGPDTWRAAVDHALDEATRRVGKLFADHARTARAPALPVAGADRAS